MLYITLTKVVKEHLANLLGLTSVYDEHLQRLSCNMICSAQLLVPLDLICVTWKIYLDLSHGNFFSWKEFPLQLKQ